MTDRAPSRRKALAVTAGAAAGIVAAPWVRAQGRTVLRYLNQGVSAFPELQAQAADAIGIEIETTILTDAEIFRTLVTNPNAFDIVDIDISHARQLFRLGRLQAIDAHEISRVDDLHPVLTTGQVAGVQVSGEGDAPFRTMFAAHQQGREFASEPSRWLVTLPTVYNADTLGVRPDLISRPVRSWGDLLSPDFAGVSAIMNIPNIGILDAAMAAEALGLIRYGNKGQMTRQEIDKTIDVLIDAKRRGQFAALWGTFVESVDLMRSGRVHLQSMWSPAVTVLRQEGVPCVYQPLREGYRGWTHGLCIPATVTGASRDAAYAYANWALAGDRGAFLLRQGYYPSVMKTARAAMAPGEWTFWIDGMPSALPVPGPGGVAVAPAGTRPDGGAFDRRMSKIVCWNSLMDEARYLVRQWRRFVND